MPSQLRQPLLSHASGVVSHASGEVSARGPGVGQPAVAPGGNAFTQSQLQGSDASKVAQEVELLGTALRQMGGKPLDREQQERLATLRAQLSAAEGMLRAGDIEAAKGLVSSLDHEAGGLVKDSGTVLEMAPREPAGRGGDFEGVSTLYVNGMSQTLTESMARSGELADIRGTDVGLVYNRTDGFMDDLGEAAAQKLQHVVPGYEHRSREGGTLAGAIDERMDAGNQVDVVTHSQGANFAKEAVQRLDNGRANENRLEEQLHLTMMGAPLDSDELPDHFDNVTFLEEKDDLVGNHLGRRDRDGERSWWEKLPVIGRDAPRSGHEVVAFDDEEKGPLSGAHDPRTYLSHPDSVAALQRNPFAGR